MSYMMGAAFCTLKIFTMKKTLFSLAIVLGLAVSSYAQVGEYKVGPKFGVGASFLRADKSNAGDHDLHGVPVVNLGLTGDFFILNMLSVGGTVGYRQKGYVYEAKPPLGSSFNLWNYNHYIGLDLVPKLHLGGNTTALYVGLGPRIDFMVDHSIYRGNDDNLIEKAVKDQLEKYWEDSNSPVIGYTAVVGIGGPHFFFEVEYISDLTKSHDNSDDPAFNVLSANIGWKF